MSREDPLEKKMSTHSSILAWRIPWTEEPGGLQSMGLQRVGHNCVSKLHFHFLIPRTLQSSHVMVRLGKAIDTRNEHCTQHGTLSLAGAQ